MSHRIRGLAVICAVVVSATLLGAQAPQFRVERAVAPGAPGPNRLPIDVALLTGGQAFPRLTAVSAAGTRARGGVSDLRLYDTGGREVPYLLLDPPPTAPAWTPGTILPIAAAKETSGFEADLRTPARIDRIRVEGIPAPFLKRAVLEGSGDRERWTVLAAEATLFDLPNERLRRVEVDFPAGEYRYFRITWNDANSGRVPPPARLEGRRVPDGVVRTPSLTAPVAFERRPSEPQRSRFRLQLPAANLPIVMVRLEVDGAYLMRHATVSEARFDGRQVQPSVIGTATLKRVTRDGMQADELTIPLARSPQESQLDISVDDGDNDPLTIRAVSAIFAELPTIYFESDGAPLVARYGDARLAAPRYDLEAARASVQLETAATAAWGEPKMVTSVEAAASVPTSGAGTVIDLAPFAYARDIAPGAPGLVAVPLDPAVLSHSRGVDDNFADLRVVDGGGRQIPYVIERLDEPMTVDLGVTANANPPAGASRAAKQSWYRVELPYAGLPDARMTLRTSARVFRRQIHLLRPNPNAAARRAPDHLTIGNYQWVHASESATAPPLVVAVPESDQREVFVGVDEGDNTPLPIAQASLLLPSYRIRFFRPEESALRLVYGRETLASPEYDLALLAPQVLGAAATEVTLAAETSAPGAVENTDVLVRPVVFWAVLGLVILVLLGIIARLVRAEQPAAPTET